MLSMAFVFMAMLILSMWVAGLTANSAIIVAGVAVAVYALIRALFAKGA